MQELCIWHEYLRLEVDRFWVRSRQTHLKIVSASAATQFRKFYSDPHIKRSWPSAVVMHLAQISMARGGSVLDSFGLNASKNRIGVKSGPVPQSLFRSRFHETKLVQCRSQVSGTNIFGKRRISSEFVQAKCI